MARALVLVSCCYHHLAGRGRALQGFPLSRALAALRPAPALASPYMLRLAAQERLERWEEQGEEEHRRHMEEMGRRGVVEVVAERRGLVVGKKRGKKGGIRWGVGWEEGQVLDREVEEEVKSSRHLFPLLELLTGLQCLVQEVVEELVVVDRAERLREQGVGEVRVVRVFQGGISPRNLALCCTKQQLQQPSEQAFNTPGSSEKCPVTPETSEKSSIPSDASEKQSLAFDTSEKSTLTPVNGESFHPTVVSPCLHQAPEKSLPLHQAPVKNSHFHKI